MSIKFFDVINYKKTDKKFAMIHKCRSQGRIKKGTEKIAKQILLKMCNRMSKQFNLKKGTILYN